MDSCQRCATPMVNAHKARKFCAPCIKAKNSEHVKAWRERKKAGTVVTG